jgi:hypothetical protein
MGRRPSSFLYFGFSRSLERAAERVERIYIEPTMSQSCAMVIGSLTAAPVVPEVPVVVLAVVSPDVPVVPVVVPVVPVVPLALAVVSVDVPLVPVVPVVVPVVPLALAVVSVDVPEPLPVVGVVVPVEAVCIVLQSCSTCACCSGVRLDQADLISAPLFNDVIVLSLKKASAIGPLQFAVVLFSASVICSMPGDAEVLSEVPEVAPEVVSLVPELVCAIADEAMARDTAAARMSLCFI